MWIVLGRGVSAGLGWLRQSLWQWQRAAVSSWIYFPARLPWRLPPPKLSCHPVARRWNCVVAGMDGQQVVRRDVHRGSPQVGALEHNDNRHIILLSEAPAGLSAAALRTRHAST